MLVGSVRGVVRPAGLRPPESPTDALSKRGGPGGSGGTGGVGAGGGILQRCWAPGCLSIDGEVVSLGGGGNPGNGGTIKVLAPNVRRESFEPRLRAGRVCFADLAGEGLCR